MDTQKLEKGNELNYIIERNEKVLDHFARLPEKDPTKEVEQLLTSYNNLLSGFKRKDIAEIMITAFKENLEVELKEARIEFEKL